MKFQEEKTPLLPPSMKIQIDDLTVYFPYEYIYTEQLKYIKELKQTLDNRGHCLIEMPSGTGKTVALLSITISYLLYKRARNEKFRVIYCSRTVQEIDKALKELSGLISYMKTHTEFNFLGLGLTARKNLCINDVALYSKNVDNTCRKLINRLENSGCDFYENLSSFFDVPSGVYDFEQLRNLGREKGICPYYFGRKCLAQADCIIYTYNYLLDPRVQSVVSKGLESSDIVIFDEAHNIGSYCIEGLSVEIKRNTLEAAARCANNIENQIKKHKAEYQKLLSVEYEKMKDRLVNPIEGTIPYYYNSPYLRVNPAGSGNTRASDNIKSKEEGVSNRILGDMGKSTNMSNISTNKNLSKPEGAYRNPNLGDQKNYEFAPGNLRNGIHFISVLKRIIEFLKTKLKTTHLTTETTDSFCQSLKELTLINKDTLKFVSQRLGILAGTLKINDEDLIHLKTVADFATLASSYSKGFSVIFEPFDSQAQTVFNPILHLSCLDSSIAMGPIFEKFKNVIITSGTLSPIEMYPKILNFTPIQIVEIGATLDRNAISPLIITKGNDQMTLKATGEGYDEEENPLGGAVHGAIPNPNSYNNPGQSTQDMKNQITTSFSLRTEPSVVRNYGLLLVELSQVVPDGIVCFFPSYLYMEEIVSLWSESNIITEISKNKLVFVETPDFRETDTALENYKTACDNGRGALLFCVARGKVSEGVDFQHGYGRCVVMLGVPFQYTESRRLKQRLQFLKEEYSVKEAEFLTFDAIRHAAQCLGRVLRNKNDYGLMIMADRRFDRKDKKSKLPK